MKKYLLILPFILLLNVKFVSAQNSLFNGQIHGTYQIDAQYYQTDTLIGAKKIPQKWAMNTFLDVIYTSDLIEAGIRYEAYYPPLQGFDPRWEGQGIPYRFVKYTKDNLEITAGNFYEQFGSGMILRAYQDWNLGFDNSIDGFRAKYKVRGLTVKGLVGKQRFFWDKGEGLIRGLDFDLSLNETFKKIENSKTRLFFGYSFVSKYQADLDPIYKLPENVAACSGRIRLVRGDFDIKAEAARKYNDPNTTNNLIYKEGNIVMLEANYSKKGLGIMLQAKRTDNMDYRSDRTATGFELPIGYIPAMSKQHIYMLPTIYPYATQANGEMGLQTTINYTFKKGSKLGGKYGTNLELNYSVANSINKSQYDDSTTIGQSGTYGYTSDFFKVGDELYYRDLNITLTKKLNSKFKFSLAYLNLFYNKTIIEGHFEPNVKANIGVYDMYYTFKPKNSLHIQAETMFTEQDNGNWAALLIEYKINNLFAAIVDQYNYGNDNKNLQIHYFSATIGYTQGTSRLSLGYGKTREGILCVGGVCRQVPASNGFTASLTSTF